MIDALVAGKLYGLAEERESKQGKAKAASNGNTPKRKRTP